VRGREARMNVLSITTDYWDGPRHNRHYFCEALARHVPTIFASPPVNIERVVKETGRGTLPKGGIREVAPGLFNYTPPPYLFVNHRLPWLNEWMKTARVDAIRRLMRRERFDDTVLLVWHPYFRDLVGRFDERLVVYYAYDQLSGYTGGDAKPSAAEIALMERADLVFVLSRELLDDKRRHVSNPDKVFHLANAVDFDLFSRARAPETIVPDDLAAIPHPRLGYIGTHNEKVDLDVVEALADRGDWHVVLIGRENYRDAAAKARFLALTARPNVHWLGHRPFDAVPAYIKGLDILMMCYVINNWTFYGDPSKLHEYLASGKPTIGAGLPAIREFADVVQIPTTPAEWVAAVERGLLETGPEATERRIETARANSYEARVTRFIDIVEASLAGRTSRA
jgi:glycosyltransferase involved in cell wall biosynthesis